MEAVRLQKKLAMGVKDEQTKSCNNKGKVVKNMACGGAYKDKKKGKKNG